MTARRVLAGLLAGAIAGAGLVAGPAVAATAPTAVVVVAPQGGGVLRQGRGLTIDVEITNTGTASLPAGDLTFSMDQQPVASASALLGKLAQPPEALQGYAIPKAEETVPQIAPGASTTVRATISAKDVASTVTTASGARLVYARYGWAGGQAIGQSTVVRMGGSARTIGFGAVVPVVAPANATGLVDTAAQQVLTDPGGGWDAAVRAAEAAPWATVALDPEVVASIRLAGDAAPPAAQDLLRRLERLPNQVVRLPYADGDVTLERAAGASKALAPTSFVGASVVADDGAGTAATPGPTATPGVEDTTVQSLTAWSWSEQGVAWPVPGTTTGADVAALAKDAVLLSSADVNDTAARRGAGPSARLGSPSGPKALIADATASSLLAAASGRGPAAGAALARLVGLLATDAVSGDTTALLATVSRSAEADGLGRALAQLDGQPWTTGRSLADLAAAAGPAVVRIKPGTTPAARVGTAKALLAGERAVRGLGSAVTSGAASVTGPQRLALLGALSAGWRGDDTGWTAAARSVGQGFTGLGDAISMQSSGSNAIGTDGRLPVFVKNGLDVPVRVVVYATVSNGRLQFTGQGVAVSVPARATSKGQLAFRSITNGSTRVTLRLTTPSGAPVGRPVERNIQVSAGFDTIVAVVLLAALGLLLALGVYRNVKRRRQPRQAVAA